jgi:hypothetical protein
MGKEMLPLLGKAALFDALDHNLWNSVLRRHQMPASTATSALSGLTGSALTDAGNSALQADNDANFARQIATTIMTNDATSAVTQANMWGKLGDAMAGVSAK